MTTRHSKTNPECTARRHGPSLGSWRRGCACEAARSAMILWVKEAAPDSCPGKRHGTTQTAWTDGCRCIEAMVAHEEWKWRRRVERLAAVKHWQRTGQCGARKHTPTEYSYMSGCRCPETIAALAPNRAKLRERFHSAGDEPRPSNPWRQGKMLVNRNNLRMLLWGFPDKPTLAEKMAATMILSRRGGAAGLYTKAEIARRIGVESVDQYFARVERLRGERTQRRLADKRCKALRVARAMARAAHSAG